MACAAREAELVSITQSIAALKQQTFTAKDIDALVYGAVHAVIACLTRTIPPKSPQSLLVIVSIRCVSSHFC